MLRCRSDKLRLISTQLHVQGNPEGPTKVQNIVSSCEGADDAVIVGQNHVKAVINLLKRQFGNDVAGTLAACIHHTETDPFLCVSIPVHCRVEV